ncbi:hypothetical protein EUGRSUZ_H01348 [Eucalyptus grandis]|uniref:Uncharacterized protein n=3 Tax=Eucalyptus TaxID=3932 RepID=A0ACC3JPD5_EUCGR|nr:hypothetical protein EUGRSUZ_H01348 [Eucalyptus grandis]
MRKACRRMWRAVPCTSRKTLRTESQKDIEVILKTKLATIQEEPEFSDDNMTPSRRRRAIKKGRKFEAKVKMGHLFMPQFSFRDSYALFITGFASKGSFGGLLSY